MYQWIYLNLAGKTLFVCVVIMLIAAGVLHQRSAWVKAYGISIGLVFACILGLDGFLSSELRFIPYVETEWYRLLFVTAITLGLTSIQIRFAELAYTGYDHVVRRNKEIAEQKLRAAEQASRDAEIARKKEEARLEHEAGQPERDRLAKEEAERRKVANEKYMADAERRENARKSCLLTYHRYSTEISASLSWERFAEFMTRFMGDSTSAEVVETRGKELQDMILSYIESKNSRKKSKHNSLSELVAEFQAQRDEINAVITDTEQRDSLLALTAIEEARAKREFFSK